MRSHLIRAEVVVPIITMLGAIIVEFSNAQIVSHELRRLAVATNQFGIDALKALDRIEPPDKVLVFCPVCLSSSLVMIMMGSSKYPVVNAMRQALYVWSMKPQEINRGFKDIFDHIGLNQYQPTKESHGEKRTSRYVLNGTDQPAPSPGSQYLSLPKLLMLKEFYERMAKDNSRWIEQDFKRSLSKSMEGLSPGHSNGTSPAQSGAVESRQQAAGKRDMGDLSQMSATSNIYVQRGLNINYDYNTMLRKYYKTVIHPVDFVRNAEETRQHINSLVAANTEGKIKDLVRRDTFANSTLKNPRIMIISTFHFRGTLDIQLKNKPPSSSAINKVKSKRRDSGRSSIEQNQIELSPPLINNKISQLFIETEETLLKYGYFANLDCNVIEIPFNNRLVSLIILMPNHLNSTELLLTKLSGQILSDMINSLAVKKLSIEIPIIKFDRGPINVEGTLKELGLDEYFTGKNKLYSSDSGLNKWMHPHDIVHETSIDIGTINPKFAHTEDRLKVGAHEDHPPASGSGRKVRKGDADPSHMRLDKPFFYFVLDSINGLMLTMGRIR